MTRRFAYKYVRPAVEGSRSRAATGRVTGSIDVAPVLIAALLPALLAVLLVVLVGAPRPAFGQSDANVAPVGVMQDNVVVLVDASGSMNESMRGTKQTKMELAKEALIRVLADVPETTNVGILVFSGRNVPDEWIYPLGPIDRERLMTAVQRPRASGGTPLGRYMKVATDRLLDQRTEQRGYGTYRLLIVTDGEARDQPLVDRYTPDIVSRGIVVDVIGVSMKSTHTLATRVHSYRSADDPDALVRAVSDVFAEVGRSTGDDATGEDEFELIQAIPAEIAGSVIQTLTRSGNHPIGSNTQRRARRVGNTPPNLPSTGPGTTSGPSSTPSGGSGMPRITIGTLIFALLVLSVIVRKIVRMSGGR